METMQHKNIVYINIVFISHFRHDRVNDWPDSDVPSCCMAHLKVFWNSINKFTFMGCLYPNVHF